MAKKIIITSCADCGIRYSHNGMPDCTYAINDDDGISNRCPLKDENKWKPMTELPESEVKVVVRTKDVKCYEIGYYDFKMAWQVDNHDDCGVSYMREEISEHPENCEWIEIPE